MEFNPAQVVVTPGGKPMLLLPMLALLEAGDEVIYPDPGFPTYAAAIGLAGATPVPIPLLEEAGVALLSGTSFGANGEGYLRLSYANSVENIQKALECMAEALDALC